MTNARGLARTYAQFATRVADVELVSADTVARMRDASATGRDEVGLIPTRLPIGAS